MVSDESDDRLAQQLRALRGEYLADSTQRVAELRRLFTRLSSGDRSALAELRQAFHRLAGSGGSYGLPVVSTQSGEGEHLARRLESASAPVAPDDLAVLSAALEGVARAFAEARQALETGESG